MKYLVPNDGTKMPRVHISKEGRALCGAQLDMARHIEREGTNGSVEFCWHCQQRHHKLNAMAGTEWTPGKLAAYNLERIREFNAQEAAEEAEYRELLERMAQAGMLIEAAQ